MFFFIVVCFGVCIVSRIIGINSEIRFFFKDCSCKEKDKSFLRI